MEGDKFCIKIEQRIQAQLLNCVLMILSLKTIKKLPKTSICIFLKLVPNLAKTITQGGKTFHDFLTAPNDHSIFLVPTNSEELLKIVRKLKTNKAPGYDDIDNIILKHIINYILDPLVFLLNLSLQSGKVPSDMKIAKVIPVLKKGDRLCVNNYRPISLLTCLSKILEKIVYS